MRVLDAQQLLRLLRIDAPQLSEDGHDLQEEEPVGGQGRRWGVSLPVRRQSGPLLVPASSFPTHRPESLDQRPPEKTQTLQVSLEARGVIILIKMSTG